MLPNLTTVLTGLPERTLLALSSRGRSYGGYSSEIFGVERTLYGKVLALWTDGRNTESFVLRLRDILDAIDASRWVTMPRMRAIGRIRRYSDKRRMTYF